MSPPVVHQCPTKAFAQCTRKRKASKRTHAHTHGERAVAGARRPSTTGSSDHVHGCPASIADIATSATAQWCRDNSSSSSANLPRHLWIRRRRQPGRLLQQEWEKKKNGKEKWGASVFLDVFTHRMQHWESEKASTKGKLRSEHSCISVVWEGGSSSSGGLPGRAPPPGAICKSGVRRCLVDRLPQEVPHYWRTM